MKELLTVILSLLLSLLSFGQNSALTESFETRGKIELLARPYPDSILLRWAPNTPVLWSEANQKGYVIERWTVLKNGQFSDKKYWGSPFADTIKIYSETQWAELVKTDSLAPIAAQCIFSEYLNISSNSSDIYSMINKTKENENRFSFALFSADQSVQVAKASGLFYADKKVNKDEKYIYKIYIPDSKLTFDTGYYFVGPGEAYDLPAPAEFSANFEGNIARLSWNQNQFSSIYSTYILERSIDSIVFDVRGNLPFVNLGGESDYAVRIDSLEEFNKQYKYRLRGKTIFGELGPPAYSQSGHKTEVLKVTVPAIKTVKKSGQNIQVLWVFQKIDESKISGFELYTSDCASCTFTLLATAEPSKRVINAGANEFIQYLKIAVVGKNGGRIFSLPYLAQFPDSIPPATPTGISGKIDTSGIVKINWKRNSEKDLYGYRVFTGNSLKEHFTQLTKEAIKDTFFIDTININVLDKRRYYRIVALDKNFNPSISTEILELIIPDIVAPISPVIKNYIKTDTAVVIYFIPSNSKDVKGHLLLLENKDHKGIVLDTIKTQGFVYLNQIGQEYLPAWISIAAFDESGNRSTENFSIPLYESDFRKNSGVKNFGVNVETDKHQIRLNWDEEEESGKYLIYRKHNSEKYNLIATVRNVNVFIDVELKINSSYRYFVKFIKDTDTYSLISQEIEVEY